MMSDLKMISPLLDGLNLEKEHIGQNGRSSYILRKDDKDEHYILKIISLPENDSRIRALILSGAYPDEAAVHAYYGNLAEDIAKELSIGQRLSKNGGFVGAISHQIEAKESGVGYDVYVLYPLNISLGEFVNMNAMTHLRAVNLAIDLCDSVIACRQGGYMHMNITPENVYLLPNGKFLLGGLGLTEIEFLKYATVPEEYIGAYSAPELSDIMMTANHTVDIYSLGMLLYRIYNGNHSPFEDESTNGAMADKLRLTGKPLPTPIYADYELAAIVLKACAFKKEDRYQTPEEMKQDIVNYLQRNNISDSLIAPPIVAELDPLPLIDEPTEEGPIRMTDADALDENFRESFAPDRSTVGNDVVTEEAEQPETPVEEADAVAEEAPADLPEQMDFDALMASVNEYIDAPGPNVEFTVGVSKDDQITPSEEPELSKEAEQVQETSVPMHEYADKISADTLSDEDEPSEKKKTSRLRWIVIAAIFLALAVGGYFLINWYFIDVTEIKSVSTTPSQIIVEIISDDNPEHFNVLCTDSFGNVHTALRSDHQYCFADLKEKTSYTISVEAAKYHDFSTAVPSMVETTNEYTTISDIKLERLNNDGDVMLSFDHKGPVPSQWKLSYAQSDGSDAHTYRFDGESYQINGLELYKTYVFTIENVDSIFIVGENSTEYDVYPRVVVSNFEIKNIVDNTITLGWDSTASTPDKWTISYQEPSGNYKRVETTETTIDITVPDFKTAYIFSLFTHGMADPEHLELVENPIIVNNLNASADENGNLIVTWDTPAGEPDGQWRISYKLKDGYYNEEEGYAVPSVSCSSAVENSVTLQYLPSNAYYEITLMALDTDSNTYPRIFGTTTIEASTADAIPFNGYQILPATPYGDGYESDSLIALWKKPDKDTWDFRDLLSERRTSFKSDEDIAMCIQIDSCDLSTAVINDKVHVTYVVRRASQGGVILVDDREMTWASVWFERRHTGIVPKPLQLDADGKTTVQTGRFLVEVYINGKLLAQKGFTIEA
ncbi:MAG: hypothetical protein E7467_04795 [Ruminococcaceae bacterium]|nr:hypothetical protein [Oscillospiraceae bacterium]